METNEGAAGKRGEWGYDAYYWGSDDYYYSMEWMDEEGYNSYYGSFDEDDEPSVKDKIRDAFSEAWDNLGDKYADETAISEWWEETSAAAEEMQ